MGGVGTKPWRSPEAEAAVVGKPAEVANFRKAAEAAMRRQPPEREWLQVELAKRCLTHALENGRDRLIPQKEQPCRQTFLHWSQRHHAWKAR